VAEQPIVSHTSMPVSVEGRTVVLVDDVLFTGRTARAALDAIMDLGRPARGAAGRSWLTGATESWPIRADYVGKNVPTSAKEVIAVRLRETDQDERVLILERD